MTEGTGSALPPASNGAGGTTAGGAPAGGATGGAGPSVPQPGASGASSFSDAGLAGPSSQMPPPVGLCQQITIDSGHVTPDMLIVLDRSSSMQGQGVDRWTPSVRGLKAVTSELDDNIRFGLMAFPGRGTATLLGGGMSCAPGTLEVPIGLNAAPAIASSLDSLTLIQSTPTAATLDAAHTVLGSGATAVDSVTAAKYVILVTDGGPNCSDGAGGGGLRGQDAAAVTASVAAITAMQKDGIKTYVLGYDTASDPALKAVLDQMAKAGGTGDTEHRPIEDEASLVAEFRRITGGATSCEFTLNPAPSDPNYVLAQLDGTKLDLNNLDGFSLSPDHKRLTVTGAACMKLQGVTGVHNLTIKVECERQTPLF